LVNDFSSTAYLRGTYTNGRMKVKRISEAEFVTCSKVLAVHLQQMTQANHKNTGLLMQHHISNSEFFRIQIIRPTVK